MANKAPPLATVRREQASYDPLFDHTSTTNNRASATSPIITSQPEAQSRNVDNENSSSFPPPAPFASSRLSGGVDVVEMMAEAILQDTKVRPINLGDVSADKKGLVTLAANAAWTQVARFSSSMLASSAQKQLSSQEYYSILLLRYEALYRLKMFDELLGEIASLFNTSFNDPEKLSLLILDSNMFDIYCSFRILKYEANVQCGQSQVGFRELQETQSWLKELLKVYPEEKDHIRACYWLWQIDLDFINFYIRNRNWKMALQLHRKLLLQINELLDQYPASTPDSLDLTAAKVMLLCRAARLLLQIGASKAGKAHFEEASVLVSSNAVLNSDGYLQSLLLVTQGLILFSEDKYDKAAEIFSTFLDGEWSKLYERVSRVVVQPVEILNKPKSILSLLLQAKDENLLCSAVNNYAICCLYLKRNNESMTKMEKLIGSNPPKYLTDPIVFNLCTMYDLSFAPDISLAKKKALQKVSAKYGISDPILNWRSFRLN